MQLKEFKKLSLEEGEELVKMARKIVLEFLTNRRLLKESEFFFKFNFNSGVFVTINKKNVLRGCIGFPFPIKTLSEGLIDASIAAAIEDPRFPPVTLDEFGKIDFEVTVLSPPTEIIIKDPMEYLSIIKIGRDGLIAENSGKSGLLLPQVPTEYGWNAEQFLANTCEKAGLEQDAWKDKSTKISRFEGIVFKEESPNGRIILKSLE